MNMSYFHGLSMVIRDTNRHHLHNNNNNNNSDNIYLKTNIQKSSIDHVQSVVRLYKRFIQTDKNNVALFDTLKEEYHIYRTSLRRTIREAKRMFYAKTFLL